jgi:hypothetical protein
VTSAELVAIAVAAIAAFGSIAAATIGLFNRGKLDVIHVLVNSNLEKIRERLAQALLDRDQAQAERDLAHAELRAQAAPPPSIDVPMVEP